jgi:cardiolipin synthase A/B
LSLFFILILSDLSGLEEITLYSSDCGDLLRPLVIQTLNEASMKAEIRIYTLKDRKVLEALDMLSRKGKILSLYIPQDHPTLPFHATPLFTFQPAIECKGLMHQKILVCDEKLILLGSANFTEDSLVRHQNLIVKMECPELAHTLREKNTHTTFTAYGQMFEYWETPKKEKEALTRLLTLIREAKESIRIAMYTWTHKEITRALISAHQRGVKVEAFLDPGSARGTSRKIATLLREEGIPLYLPTQCEMVHHKTMEIDEKILVTGSLNWTLNAFKKNQDAFLVLHALTPKQKAKLSKLWRRLHCLSVTKKNGALDSIPWKYPIDPLQ